MSPIPKGAGVMRRIQVRAAKIVNNKLRLNQRPPLPPDLQLEVDARVAAREVADQAELAVVEGPVCRTASSTDCFFCRRVNRMTRALGSPKIPDTLCSGVNGGK